MFAVAAIVASAAHGHGGLLDDGGGHVHQSTGQYHCHEPDCVPPATISVVSFKIQFLGDSTTRDDEALAELMVPHDIVVVQELVSPPFSGTYPNGDPFIPDPQSAEFFDAMATHGFEFILSPAGFIAESRANHDDYERVPFAFAFRTLDDSLDFVLVSVHLKPNAGAEDAARRAHELASIAKWIDDQPDDERDYIILGDMNIQSCDELVRATPPGFKSLNDACVATNTNLNAPRPFDHVMYRAIDTTVAEMPRQLEVLNLIELLKEPWFSKNSNPYPGNPYNHDLFRATFSDHHPVAFQLIPSEDDD